MEIEKIATYYGYGHQSRQLIEEMAELTQAINKFWRYEMLCSDYLPTEDTNRSFRAHIAEEIADVEICIEQVKYLLGIKNEVESWRDEKIKRTLKGAGNDVRG